MCVCVSFNESQYKVGEERAWFSVIAYSKFCCFCSEEFYLPLCAWERLRYFIVALPGHSINLFPLYIGFSYAKKSLATLYSELATCNA